MIALTAVLIQASGWTAAPARPTVGDTIRLERTIVTPPGWRVRAGKLEGGEDVEQLGDVAVIPAANGWTVRYFAVAWQPGAGTIAMPPMWRLGPDGTADSVPGGTATVQVASVIPDSIRSPAPQPSLGPLRLARASPVPLIAALLLAAGALTGLIAWRRRGPRVIADGLPPGLAVDPDVPDERWLAAGEPKAVAARAAHGLRSAIARAIPEAHEALSTAECLQTVERARPKAPLRELRELLAQLDQVAFATAHSTDVAPLAARARALAKELGKNGASKS